MKLILSRSLAALILVSLWIASGPAMAGPRLVFDIKTGAVLALEKPNDLWYPASLTKMMTAYVALEAVRDGRFKLETLLIASKRAANQPPSKIGIQPGHAITMGDALRLLFVKSANDIAVVVAENVSGSVEKFAIDMNSAAARLGMTRSRFVNPHGLPDPNQVTTARDLALLTRALVQVFPEANAIYRLPFVRVGKSTIRSYNPLIGRFEGGDGMKTGFVCASGFNFVGTATRAGRRLGVVLMGETSAQDRKTNAETLLTSGFAEPAYTSSELPSLSTLAALPGSDTPVNLRPTVCAGGVLPASAIPGGRATGDESLKRRIRYGPPAQLAALGLSLRVPLPVARPKDIPVSEAVTSLAVSSEKETDPPFNSTRTIPLPKPRPALES